MPLLGFTKMKDKLLEGSKTQTIRKPRKHLIKVGDKLYIYWKLRTKECKKLGEGIVTTIQTKHLSQVTEQEAIKDGFRSFKALYEAFVKMYGGFWNIRGDWRIITWRWTDGPHKEA